ALGHGNLHVVNVSAIPNRLVNPVGEAKDQQVLDGLFAQVMINAKDLLLVENTRHLAVQLPGAREVAPEGFLNDDARPVLRRISRSRQARRTQVLDDDREEAWRRGKVKQPVASGAPLAVEPIEHRAQLAVGFDVAKIIADIKK